MHADPRTIRGLVRRSALRFARCALALIATLCLAAGAAAQLEVLDAASPCSPGHGAWFIYKAETVGVGVAYIAPDDPPSMYRRVMGLRSVPTNIAAGDDRLVVVFDRTLPAAGRSAVRAVREIVATPGPDDIYLFDDLSPLAHLPGQGALDHLVHTEFGLVAALSSLPGSRDTQWLLLETNEWVSIASPGPRGVADTVVPFEDSIAARFADRWLVYDRDKNAWTDHDLGVPGDADLLVPLDRQLIALAHNSGVWSASSFNAQRWREFARLEAPPGAHALALGRRLVLVYAGVSAPDQLWFQTVTLDGEVRHDGPAVSRSAVRAEGLDVVLLIIAAMMVATLALAAHPAASGTYISPKLPEHTALADPPRRLLATMVDFMPGFWAAWIAFAWDAETTQGLLQTLALESGPWPVLMFLGITIGHTTILEMLTGKTIGKSVMNIRSVTTAGERPSASVLLWRNATKALLPPIALLVMFRPWVPRPGSGETWVVVELPIPPGPDEKKPRDPDER